MDNQSATSKANATKGKGKCSVQTRRYWTKKEEEVLLILLEALVAEGWKSDGTFQGGYMIRLEREMNEQLLGCGLTRKNIKNKMTVWKKTHFAILGMLSCSGAAGFSMDPILNVIIEDKPDAWGDYGKANPAALKYVKGKTHPWQVRWKHIFGTDNAAGGDRVDFSDAKEAVNVKGKHVEIPPGTNTNASTYNVTNTDFDDDDDSCKGSSKENDTQKGASSKKRKAAVDDPDRITTLIGDWMESAKSHIGEVSNKMMVGVGQEVEQPNNQSNKRAQLFDVVAELGSMGMENIVKVTRYLSRNQPEQDIFWSMPSDARVLFVGQILSDNSS